MTKIFEGLAKKIIFQDYRHHRNGKDRLWVRRDERRIFFFFKAELKNVVV